MAINLLNIEPNKVSTDATSYSLFIYGPPKSGKTTFIHNLYGKRVLFLATEDRHKALPGAMVQRITSWNDYLQALGQARNPKVKEMFDVIAIDTVENLYAMLEKFVAAKYSENTVGERDDLWGKDWSDLKNNWRDGLRMIENLGYTPCFVAHATQTIQKVPVISTNQDDAEKANAKLVKDKKTDEEFYEVEKWTPDLKDKVLAPVNRMVDNILFLNFAADENGNESRVIHLRETLQWQAGTTFPDIRPVIPATADEYQNAIQEALSKYNLEDTKEERANRVLDEQITTEVFNSKMDEAKKLAVEFHKANRMDEVNNIVSEVFGLDKKLTDAKINQYPLVSLVVDRLNEIK